MDRRKIKVTYNNEARSLYVKEGRVKKETLDMIFCTSGNLTYKLDDEIFCLEVDEFNFILEEKIDEYIYKDRKVEETKIPSGITPTSRKRLSEIFSKFENAKTSKKKDVGKKLGNKKQSEKSNSIDSDIKEEEHKEISVLPEVAVCQRTASYKKKIVQIIWLHKRYLGDTQKPKGVKRSVTLNGAINYSIHELKDIFKTHLINEIGYSSQDFEGCLLEIGKANGEPIEEFTASDGSTIDVWTYAANHRDGNHYFKLSLLTTKMQPTEKELNVSGKNSISNLNSGVFGHHNRAFSNRKPESNSSILVDSSKLSNNQNFYNKEDSVASLEKENKKSLSLSKSYELKDDSSSNFPDAASMLKKQDSSYVRLKNELDVFKKPGNFNEQALKSVSMDKIKLFGPIAAGGQGVIKKGIFRGTPVALKFIQKGKWDKCAQKEIALLAMLRHPHIICAIAQSSTQIHDVIVMEFFEEDSLHDILLDVNKKQMYNLNEKSKMIIGKQMCMAINFCHSNDPEPIIHRDIKPSNVLVNVSLLTKLCDFGLGRCKDLRTSIQPTVKNGVVGTYGYMPPEIIVHGKEATINSDTWSAGATLTELFSEKDLWETSVSGILSMAKMEKPNIEKVPEYLKEIFSRIINYIPTERPTMMEILEKF